MRIKLTQGKFAIVGPRDYKYLSQFKWYCHSGGYAARRSPRVDGKSIIILMHRIILERMGCTDFKDSDHINQDKLDNRRSNLRPATRSQNMQNTDRRSNNTSGFTGVYWDGRCKKWYVQIWFGGRCRWAGYFSSKKQAIKARQELAKKYHGDFACQQ